MAPPALAVAEGEDRVAGEDDVEHQAQVEDVAVHVLEDQREAALAGVLAVRLGHRAGRRRHPERAVVGLAVVVAGEAEGQRDPGGQQRGREHPPGDRRVAELGARHAARREAGRVVDGDVRLGEVVLVAEHAPRRVDDEGRQREERERGLDPPPIGAQGPRPDLSASWCLNAGRGHTSLPVLRCRLIRGRVCQGPLARARRPCLYSPDRDPGHIAATRPQRRNPALPGPVSSVPP